jgi:hypothetical protein
MTMTQTAEVTAASGKAGSEMGYSVAISGTTLIAGAPYVRNQQGVAYVFNEPPGGWQDEAAGEAIVANDAMSNNLFGLRVAIGGGVLGIATPYWPGPYPNSDGAVYIFGPAQ